MGAIEILLLKAAEEGIEVSGVKPISFPGRGIGVVATRNIKQGEAVMTIPTEAIRSLDTLPEEISLCLSPDMTIQGLLAAEITLRLDDMVEWASVLPQWTDFEATMPILWPKQLQQLLPAEAKSIVTKQHARFETDWDMFKEGFPNELRQDYLYAWLLVNTRSFYFDTSTMMIYPWHDRLALIPVADLFNHADTGCAVSFTSEKYTITADRSYQAGDEVCTSYGEHSNDYLWAEYGFLLTDNGHDKLCLDEVILEKLSVAQRSELLEKGYLGDFMLQPGSMKHGNIWIALRLLCCADAQWQSYIDGEEDGEGTLKKAADLLPALLEEYMASIKETLKAIRALHIGKPYQREMLVQRWEQLEALVREAAVA